MDGLLSLLKRLNDSGVEYVLIGGLAAIVHGGSIVTDDVDVCTSFDDENMPKILYALRDVNPTHRMRPDKMRLAEDAAHFRGLKNLYVGTDVGVIDFLGEVPHFGSYEDVRKHSTLMNIAGVSCRVINADALIAIKRAVGRPKDLRVVRELESLLWLQREIRRDEGNL